VDAGYLAAAGTSWGCHAAHVHPAFAATFTACGRRLGFGDQQEVQRQWAVLAKLAAAAGVDPARLHRHRFDAARDQLLAAVADRHGGHAPNSLTTPLHGLEATLAALGVLTDPRPKAGTTTCRRGHWEELGTRAPVLTTTMRRYLGEPGSRLTGVTRLRSGTAQHGGRRGQVARATPATGREARPRPPGDWSSGKGVTAMMPQRGSRFATSCRAARRRRRELTSTRSVGSPAGAGLVRSSPVSTLARKILSEALPGGLPGGAQDGADSGPGLVLRPGSGNRGGKLGVGLVYRGVGGGRSDVGPSRARLAAVRMTARSPTAGAPAHHGGQR
jgi:hypothetical protein